MSATWASSLLVLVPLAAAGLAFCTAKRGAWVGAGAAVGVGAAVVTLAGKVLQEGEQRHRVGGWGAPLGIEMRADGFGVLMLLMTAGIAVAVMGYSHCYFGGGKDMEALHRRRYFWPLFHFLWAALNALFLSSDIFNLYVTLELLGLAAATLVALAGRRESLRAAWRYLIVGLAASLFYLLGVGLVYAQLGTVDLGLLASRQEAGPTLWVALILMTGGLMAKAALFPLHFWLPPAHANAPAPVSAVLSALVVKGPFYILLRIWFEAFPGLLNVAVAQSLGLLGGLAIVWGSYQALVQTRFKLLVAYSTVAQLGYLFLMFPLGWATGGGGAAWEGGVMLIGAHACAKTAMFLAAGNVLHAVGHDRMQDLGGLSRGVPVSTLAMGLAGISLVGLPPSGGFAGKWLLLQATLEQGQWWWTAVLLAGGLLAAAYVARVMVCALATPEITRPYEPVPRGMEWAALLLALIAAGMGFQTQAAIELLNTGAMRSGFEGVVP